MKAGKPSNQEVEIKLALPDPATGRRLLRAAGFRVWKRRVFEANTVFDTRGLKLRRAQCLLRVRQAGRTYTVTYKGRPEASTYKSREELETTVTDADSMSAILDRLSYRPVFRYEKYRTEFRQTPAGGVATLDETPVGAYLELEGAPRWIDRTARRLGFSEREYITVSYVRLYLDWCKQNGVTPTDMVFQR